MRLKDFEAKVMDKGIPGLRIAGFLLSHGHVTRCVARGDTFVVVWLWSGWAYVNYPDAETVALADDELVDKMSKWSDVEIISNANTDGVDWWRERRYDIHPY